MSRQDNPSRAQHRIAEAVAKMVGTWVDPCCVKMYPALGYWAHNHQDVQRWTGSVEVEGVPLSIGSWDVTISDLNKGRKFNLKDDRQNSLGDNHFQVWAE